MPAGSPGGSPQLRPAQSGARVRRTIRHGGEGSFGSTPCPRPGSASSPQTSPTNPMTASPAKRTSQEPSSGPSEGCEGQDRSRAVDEVGWKVLGTRLDAVLTGHGGKRRLDVEGARRLGAPFPATCIAHILNWYRVEERNWQ